MLFQPRTVLQSLLLTKMIINQHSSSSFSKFFNTHSHFNFLHNLFFFVFGFSMGIIFAFYFQNFFVVFKPTEPISLLPLSSAPLGYLSPPTHSENSSTIEDTDEKDLFWRASNVPKTNIDARKVAFMFLASGDLPLAPIWEKFFKGHEGKYSIYVHSHPLFSDTMPKGSVFHGTRTPSKVVEWGTTSMIDAERRLLANALLDFSNQRFVLLSESCIPLFNFTTVYDYLINSNQNFIDTFDDPKTDGRGRYNEQMSPTVSLSDWRKGSQWFAILRDLAMEVVSDTTYYPIFHDYCEMPCYADEHYLPTLANLISPEANSNRTVTLVDWSRGGAHPRRFSGKDITEEFMETMRTGRNCMYNGKDTTLCFLFARKFLRSALHELLKIAPKFWL